MTRTRCMYSAAAINVLYTLSLHDALPIFMRSDVTSGRMGAPLDVAVQITRLRNCAPFAGVRFDLWQADALGLYRSEEHTSELQSQSILVCRLLLEQKYKFPATDTHTVDIT